MAEIPSYASPATSGQLRKSQRLSDAIKAMSQQNSNVFDTATGTNLTALASIIRGHKQREAEKKGEEGLKADRTRLSEMIIGSAFPGDASHSAYPDQFTPEQQQAGSLAAQIRGISEFTGDPMAALQYGQGQQRQQLLDKRYDDETGYSRGRDTIADQQVDRQFGFQQSRATAQDSQFDRSLGQDASQFGETMAFNRDQLGATNAAKDAELALKRAELERTTNSGGFEPAQLATIYNRNMDALDTARGKQSALDTIATASQQFVDKTKDGSFGMGFWAQGEGIINDLAQGLSMDTTTLKALTDRIAPLMREAGSGASSDRDIEMFKSAVVSINNTPEANKRFAAGAKAVADRNRQYVEFLNEAIDPRDPQSRQKADRLWSLYKDDQRIFDEASGAVNEKVQPFGEWFAENVASEQAVSTPPAPSIPPGAIAKLRADPNLASAFDQKYGAGAAQSVLRQ